MWCDGKEENEDGEAVLLFQTVEQPNTKKSRSSSQSLKRTKNNDPSLSVLGGTSSFYPDDDSFVIKNHYDDNHCARCREPLYQIMQLNAPIQSLGRTLYVLGCNNASCYHEHMFSSKSNNNKSNSNDEKEEKFCFGGAGVIRCIRSQQPTSNNGNHPEVSKEVVKKEIAQENSKDQFESSIWWQGDNSENKSDGKNADLIQTDWGMDDVDDGGWGMKETTASTYVDMDNTSNNEANSSLEDLEAMLSAMERASIVTETTANANANARKKKEQANEIPKEKQTNKKQPTLQKNSFSCFELEMFDEPQCSHLTNKKHGYENDSDDDDDVMQHNAKEKDRIEALLSNYLQEEEDEELVNFLKNKDRNNYENKNSASKNANAEGNTEMYEKLSPKELAFQLFTNRLKRAPYQVARYAYGGIPIWSIPTPTILKTTKPSSKTAIKKFKKSQINTAHNKHKSSTSHGGNSCIPRCPCGSEREFEFQILPSVLHILAVDDHTKIKNDEKHSIEWMLSKSNGGMNWGTITVYSCAKSCNDYREEYVIVQESNDDDISTLKKQLQADISTH